MWKSRVSAKLILAVANNGKMTWKSDIDDVINTSKMSDMPQNFFNASNISRILYISKLKFVQSVKPTYRGQNVWKNTSGFNEGDVHSLLLWGATEITFHSFKKWAILTIDAWDNFDNTGKKHFSYLEERSQKLRKFVEWDVKPPINLSPLNSPMYEA